MVEQGYPQFVSISWNGVAAPANTPPHVVSLISQVIGAGVRKPEIATRMATLGIEPVGSTPQEMAAFMLEDIARWRKVIESAGIKVE